MQTPRAYVGIKHHVPSRRKFYTIQSTAWISKSCETQLVSLLHDLLYNLNQGVQTDIISLDFAKAFDTVPHRRLLYKLHWYGIRGKLHSWIKSFLTHRH